VADSGAVADREDRLRAEVERLCGRLPAASPLESPRNLPWPWSAAELWLKRDDRCGPGGTKMRKLAVALAEMRRLGARGLVTFGALDSNHALAAAQVARARGLRVELYVQAQDPGSLPGRRRAFAESADRVSYGRSGAALVARALLRTAGSRMSGRRLFLLPPGGTSPRTTAGVALGVLEIAEQFRALGVPPPERWAVAVGTGGTLAGLWAGIKALGLACRPVGFQASSRLVSPGLVAWLANRALREIGCLGMRVRRAEVEISDGELGEGHGLPTAASVEALERWARAGVPLDPIYTAKAAAGLGREIERAPADRWLFWHTGTAVAPIS
jgi:1-aminocyclopropane-1-carboxylate deaminase/D-cysteine desulfhydrase-like pyridoxal-dependent ACC family enzyme